MSNFIKALKQSTRPRWMNLFKVICLGIGIMLGGVILCRSAYINSYDKFLDNYDDLNFMVFHWTMGGESNGHGLRGLGPMAPEMMDKMPAVDKATRHFYQGPQDFKVGENTLRLGTSIVDTLFFEVLPFEVVTGNPKEVFAAKDGVMVSEKVAETFFPGENPIGKTFTTLKGTPFTIKGVFKTIPNNSFFRDLDVLISIEREMTDASSWTSGDAWQTYFTLKENIDRENFDTQLNEVFAPRLKWLADRNMGLRTSTHPLSDFAEFYQEGGETSAAGIYTILGILIIIVCSFNFALIQISSLVSRAKEVGVHKTSGATTSEIFRMVIWEAVIYTAMGLALAAVLLFGLRGQFEGVLGRFEDILAVQHLWALALALILVILISGFLPAAIYSRIPAVEVFRKSSSNNLWWKQGLLFIEIFVSIAVVVGAIACTLQYKFLTHFDLGYNYEKLGTTWFGGGEATRQSIKSELLGLSYVENVTYNSKPLIEGQAGYRIYNPEDGEVLFGAMRLEVDNNFLATYGIPVLDGSETLLNNPTSTMVCTDVLARSGSSLGDYKFSTAPGSNIVGVFKNIRNNLFSRPFPIVLIPRDINSNFAVLTVRFVEIPSREQMTAVNEILEKHLKRECYFRSYQENINNFYSQMRTAKYGFSVATIVLLLITIVGIFSYISTEIRAKRREIAIRRTHGASVWQIISYISKRIFIVTGIAAAIAIPGCIYGLNLLFSTFFVEQIELSWWIFAVGLGLIVSLVLIITYMQVYKLARRDYVRLIGKV